MDGLVTATMITGLPGRKKLAWAAIDAYSAQTYSRRELVIVDQDPDPILPHDRVDIKVVRAEPGISLGELRNIALRHAQGDWIIQWDDDDWYHYDRIRYQLAGTVLGKACMLNYQIRYDLSDGNMIVWKWNPTTTRGIPGTILFPHAANLSYRDEPRGEDTHFVLDHFNGRAVVVENVDFPHCYVRFYHGSNTWSRSHVMGVSERPRPKPTVAAYVQQILDQHYRDVRTASDRESPALAK